MIEAREIKIRIESGEEFNKRLSKKLKDIDEGRAEDLGEDSISFKSIDQMREFITPKRLELLRTIKKRKPKSIYELAKMVKRSPENVNTDIKTLKTMGFVKTKKTRDKRNKVVPMVNYDKITLELPV